MKKIYTLITISLFFGAANIATAKNSKLSVLTDTTNQYQCDNNSKLKVTYYSLSDSSLNFVKLMVKGDNFTLPQIVSASGTRYSDLHKIEWFSKGDTGLLTEDVTNDNSKIVRCKKINSKK